MVTPRLKTVLLSMGLVFTAQIAAADDAVPASLVRLGDSAYFSPTAIVVDKSKRTLTVWEVIQGKLHKKAEFPSDLGKFDGPKISRGDKRTPEGVYFLEKQLEGAALDFSQYGARAFTTSYPNLFDRRDGRTGDGIWLHAIPDSISLDRGSRGCVVVRNEAILEISKFIKVGQTPIVITDSVNFVPEIQIENRAKSIESTLEGWRQAWESKNLDQYMSYYDESFESLKMNKSQWRKFKQGLNEKYQTINVTFSRPAVFEHKSRVIIRALQRYQSDKHQDFGEKLLYLEERNGAYKIVAEDWAPVSNAEALQAMLNNSKAATAN